MAASRSTEEWHQLFVDYEASGESARDFCARHGLRLVYFYRRSLELRGRSARRRGPVSRSEGAAPAFVPVTVPRQDPATMRLTFGGVEMSMSSAVSPEWVAALVRALTRGTAS